MVNHAYPWAGVKLVAVPRGGRVLTLMNHAGGKLYLVHVHDAPGQLEGTVDCMDAVHVVDREPVMVVDDALWVAVELTGL